MIARGAAGRPRRRATRTALIVVASVSLGPAAARAQPLAPQQVAAWPEAAAGGELTGYLRALQGIGVVPRYPWSLRAFAPSEIDRLAPPDSAPHPWAGRVVRRATTGGRIAVAGVRPEVGAVFNSAFPVGANDAAVWAGRGLTLAAHGGIVARAGVASLVVDPVVFWAQNASFALMPNGQTDARRFGDGLYPSVVDHPQRFGDGAYARLDPGQTTLRAERWGAAIALSSANEVWGPAEQLPLVLGSNAAGIPRLYVGSAAPVDIWIGHLHGRLELGRLSQSQYSSAADDQSVRQMASVVAVFVPRGLPGLELGGSRFFHRVWPDGGPSIGDLFIPLGGLLKNRLRGSDATNGAENQIASAFVRLSLPPTLEAYAEFAREDHNADLRDLLLEPDHVSAYLLGLRRYWKTDDARRITVLRGELVNARVTHLARVRSQSPFYIHAQLVQGHTQRGQFLGSPAAFGGAGSVIGVDRYHAGGRWSVEWTRSVQGQPLGEGAPPGQWDVAHAVAASAVRFRGRVELRAGIAGVYEIDRHFEGDAFGVRLDLGARAALGRR